MDFTNVHADQLYVELFKATASSVGPIYLQKGNGEEGGESPFLVLIRRGGGGGASFFPMQNANIFIK